MAKFRGRRLRDYYSHVQMVFPDPYSSPNPAKTLGYILSRPLVNHHGLKGKRGAQPAVAGGGRRDLSDAQGAGAMAFSARGRRRATPTPTSDSTPPTTASHGGVSASSSQASSTVIIGTR